MAGKRVAPHWVKRTLICERREDCQRECGNEKRFACEGFNYRLDPSGRGQGECELIEVPLSQMDLYSSHRNRDANLIPHPDYDYYERDRSTNGCRQPSPCIDCASYLKPTTYRPPIGPKPSYNSENTAIDTYRPSHIHPPRPEIDRYGGSMFQIGYPDPFGYPDYRPPSGHYGFSSIDRNGVDQGSDYYRPGPVHRPSGPSYLPEGPDYEYRPPPHKPYIERPQRPMPPIDYGNRPERPPIDYGNRPDNYIPSQSEKPVAPNTDYSQQKPQPPPAQQKPDIPNNYPSAAYNPSHQKPEIPTPINRPDNYPSPEYNPPAQKPQIPTPIKPSRPEYNPSPPSGYPSPQNPNYENQNSGYPSPQGPNYGNQNSGYPSPQNPNYEHQNPPPSYNQGNRPSSYIPSPPLSYGQQKPDPPSNYPSAPAAYNPQQPEYPTPIRPQSPNHHTGYLDRDPPPGYGQNQGSRPNNYIPYQIAQEQSPSWGVYGGTYGSGGQTASATGVHYRPPYDYWGLRNDIKRKDGPMYHEPAGYGNDNNVYTKYGHQSYGTPYRQQFDYNSHWTRRPGNEGNSYEKS